VHLPLDLPIAPAEAERGAHGVVVAAHPRGEGAEFRPLCRGESRGQRVRVALAERRHELIAKRSGLGARWYAAPSAARRARCASVSAVTTVRISHAASRGEGVGSRGDGAAGCAPPAWGRTRLSCHGKSAKMRAYGLCARLARPADGAGDDGAVGPSDEHDPGAVEDEPLEAQFGGGGTEGRRARYISPARQRRPPSYPSAQAQRPVTISCAEPNLGVLAHAGWRRQSPAPGEGGVQSWASRPPVGGRVRPNVR
jgi:hypothetical protein